MQLPNSLVRQFVDITNDAVAANTKTVKTHQGTAVVNDDGIFVRIDGSDSLTPVSMATDARDGDIVMVRIENHKAYIANNLTSPGSGRGASDIEENLNATFDVVRAKYGVFDELRVSKEYVDDLIAGDISADSIIADRAKIQDLDVEKLNVTKAYVDELVSNDISAESIVADRAKMDLLDATYADIDFANVIALEASQAVIQGLLTAGGIIAEDISGVTGQFTKYLTGVNISGDLINAGTISTERLIIKSADSDDGILFAINDAGELDQTELTPDELKRLTLDGKIITAGTITADKIAVTDLVAFEATIGGFHITNSSLYSGVKDAADNTSHGIYLDKDGQLVVGDGTNYLAYFLDLDGVWKLDISAESIKMSSSDQTISETIDQLTNNITDVDTKIDSLEGTIDSGFTELENSQNDVVELVSENATKISELIQQSGEIDIQFTTITEAVTKINDEFVTERDERYKYIKFIDGEIWLGKEVGIGEDDFKLVIRNDRMSFLQNNMEVAYFNNNQLYVTDIQVTRSLGLGRWKWEFRENGNLGLRYI